MAKPRIFISSTYYDLRIVRADLERFIREFCYEPVLFERGHVAYGTEKKLEEYCYQEINSCDILVAIIGGRFGTASMDEKYSITQNELRAALETGKQVYIFVDKGVHSEYRTYKENKGISGIKFACVDDARVYSFLEEVYGLPTNNPITAFETTTDIVSFLQEQWAGLFQRLLQESARQKDVKIVEDMKNAIATLHQLVNFLTEERKSKDDAIKSILLANHPAFRRFAQVTKTNYRVYFETKKELDSWLKARGWKPVQKEAFDQDSYLEWTQKGSYIKLKHKIFDTTERLQLYTEKDWEDDWVEEFDLPHEDPPPPPDDDNDIPF